MDWKDTSFYKILCETTTMIYLAWWFLIFTGICTNLLYYILNQIDCDIWTISAENENMKGLCDSTTEFRVSPYH
ncbi:hypothetical protein [Bartonella machadoae]|uniref:hypothetical protein n=1 Tax=Bartonella machadoae TaxID=2893471 RepID=UPI0027E33A35|nr:hypothetical protein [Bartonella machadoae]